jgi:hypothetical protein
VAKFVAHVHILVAANSQLEKGAATKRVRGVYCIVGRSDGSVASISGWCHRSAYKKMNREERAAFRQSLDEADKADKEETTPV